MTTIAVILSVLIILWALIRGFRRISALIEAKFASMEGQARDSREHRELTFLRSFRRARDYLRMIPDGNANEINLVQLEWVKRTIERSRDLCENLAFGSIPCGAYRGHLDDFAVAADELLGAIEHLAHLEMSAPAAEREAAVRKVRARATTFAHLHPENTLS